MTPSRLERDRLRAAVRHAQDAQRLLGDLQHRRSKPTRQLATDLAIIMEQLDLAVAVLNDSKADHWGAIPILASVVRELAGLNGADVAGARDSARLAYESLFGT
jgi:hypothetical protein